MVKKKKQTKKVSKKKAPEQVAADNVYATLAKYPPFPNNENLTLAGAFKTVRTCELQKDNSAQSEILGIARQGKDALIKAILPSIMASPILRVMDLSIVADAIANELRLMPVWDYEHVALIDDIKMNAGLYGDMSVDTLKRALGIDDDEEVEEDKEAKDKVRDIFNAIGDSCPQNDGCDCGD